MKVQFTETVLRDANQSLIATRMPLSEFKPILGKLDEAATIPLSAGAAPHSTPAFAIWRGSVGTAAHHREACPNTKLQMLLRGQNLLGYKHYPDDVVRKFVRKSVENGIDIIRIFDALNDLRNIEVAVDETLKAGRMRAARSASRLAPFTRWTPTLKWPERWRRWACSPSASRIWPELWARRRAMTS